MDINKPEDDINFEIKKMKFIDRLTNPRIGADEMVKEFGFQFVKTFVLKISDVAESHSAISMKKSADRVLAELYILKPIEEFPERWL